MDRKQAEDFVYKSYMRAQKYQDFNSKDGDKRHPELLRKLIRSMSVTPCAVVTGSKGKGSVSNMISRILQTGYKVGLMTSPHLENFCERFKIDDVNLDDEDFARYISLLSPQIDAIDSGLPDGVCVSPMGIQACVALMHFNSEKTDFNVFECGKGAKYDDVNNIRHDYAVINTVFLEHTRELGKTVEEIGGDKAHVITGEQRCVYTAEQEAGVLKIITDRAAEFGTALKVYGRDFWAENIRYSKQGMTFDVAVKGKRFEAVTVPLLGVHQAKNCALALALCHDAAQHGGAAAGLDLSAVREKLRQMEWPGRMEVLSSEPFVMLDACINSVSCKNVRDVMARLGFSGYTTVIGIPDDKDYLGVARTMSSVSKHIILTKSQNAHYVFSPAQRDKLLQNGITSVWTDTTEEAVYMARKINEPTVILGTTSVVSEIKKIFAKNK